LGEKRENSKRKARKGQILDFKKLRTINKNQNADLIKTYASRNNVALIIF